MFDEVTVKPSALVVNLLEAAPGLRILGAYHMYFSRTHCLTFQILTLTSTMLSIKAWEILQGDNGKTEFYFEDIIECHWIWRPHCR